MVIALAERGVDVLAVDPRAEMLDEAQRIAAGRDVTNVEWWQGSSRELPDFDGVCLVIIGDAFRWMVVRAQALAVLGAGLVYGGIGLLPRHGGTRRVGGLLPRHHPQSGRHRTPGPGPQRRRHGRPARASSVRHVPVHAGRGLHVLHLLAHRLLSFTWTAAASALGTAGLPRAARSHCRIVH
ncbi:class I SAM-dependent methyltransferase [Streptomyces sp. NPDC050703]|uniref:class I SAM-dependent methyltransferase n=1 Tax=Streptomyces sp. NPDC050703 TaxID=3157218 RepID=UPI0034229A5F